MSDILPLSSVTAREFIADCNQELRNYKKRDWTPKLTLKVINEIVQEFYELSGAKDDPKYRSKVVIPRIASAYSNVNAGASYTASTRLLVIPASGGGITWDGATAFNSSFVGAAVKINIVAEFSGSGENRGASEAAAVQPTNTYYAVVEEVVSPTTVKLTAASSSGIPNISGSALNALVTAISEQDDVYIGNLDIYKGIDKIVKITYAPSGTPKPTCEVDSMEFDYIKEIPKSANNYSEEVIWYRGGAYIYMFKGGDVSSYGKREMEVLRMPVKCTSQDDYIDVSDSNIRMIKDMVQIKMLQTLKDTQLPADLAGTAGKLQEMKKANAEEKALLKK